MIYKALVRAVVGERIKRSKWRSMLAVKALALLPAGLSLVHQKNDFMQPGFDFSKLDVLQEIEQKNKECPYVVEKHTIHAYDWRDESGKVFRNKLRTVNVIEEGSHTIEYADGITDLITIHHNTLLWNDFASNCVFFEKE